MLRLLSKSYKPLPFNLSKLSSLSLSSKKFSTESPIDKEVKSTDSNAENDLHLKSNENVVIEEYKKLIETKEKEIKKYKEQHLLDLAEMENVRMRTRRDIENEKNYALTGFSKNLLDVADNLDRSIEQFKLYPLDKDSPFTKVMEGVIMTHSSLYNVFGKFNITKFNSLGEKFNPNLQEAIFEVESITIEPGHVGQVLKEGYMIKERVLRAALVGTVKKK